MHGQTNAYSTLIINPDELHCHLFIINIDSIITSFREVVILLKIHLVGYVCLIK